MAINPEKLKKINDGLARIEKSFGKGAVQKLSDKAQQDVEVISTGSLNLDLALGVGGLPKGRVIEIYGPESSGKCLTKDAWILTAHQGYKQIEEIFAMQKLDMHCVTKEIEVVYPLINCEGNVENTTHFTFNGKRHIYNLMTQSGFIHKPTAKHPLLVLSNTGQLIWKWTSEIQQGDYLVNKNIEVFGEADDVSCDSMYAMGLLLADGTFSSYIGITNNDPDIVKFIETKLAVATGANEVVVTQKRENTIDYRINTGASVEKWYDRWGLKRAVAQEKYIPSWIFECNKMRLISFIKGYVDCESHINEGGIEICSASYRLLYQFKLLLTQFNINSTLIKQSWDVKGYEENDYWRLYIWGEDVEKYYKSIGTSSRVREEQFEIFFKSKTYYNDSIPHIKSIVLDFCKTLRRSNELQKLQTDLLSKEIEVTRTKLSKILNYAKDSQCINQFNCDTFRQLSRLLEYNYDKVVINEKGEMVPTFDFAMERTHTFIADGCINHNTTIATHVIAEAQKLGGAAAMIDAEHAFDSEYAQKLGVDIDSLYISQPDYGEQALEIADQLISTGGFDVVVVDSVAALVPKGELEGEMGDSKMGLQARMMSQAMRKLTGTIKKTNTLVIFINQLRDKIGVMFGSPETTSGGNALKFYASVRLDIRRQQQIKDGDEVLGNKTKVKVVKNKVAPPFRIAEFDIMFGKGISKEGEVLDIAVEMGIVEKSGSWFSYGKSKIGQGRDNVIQLLEDNPEMVEDIQSKIKEKIELYG